MEPECPERLRPERLCLERLPSWSQETKRHVFLLISTRYSAYLVLLERFLVSHLDPVRSPPLKFHHIHPVELVGIHH